MEKIQFNPEEEQVILRNIRIAAADEAVVINPYHMNKLQGHSPWMAYFPRDTAPTGEIFRNFSCSGLKYHLRWDWLIPAATRIIKKYMHSLHGRETIISLLDYENALYANDILKAVDALDVFIKSMVPDYFKEEKLNL